MNISKLLVTLTLVSSACKGDKNKEEPQSIEKEKAVVAEVPAVENAPPVVAAPPAVTKPARKALDFKPVKPRAAKLARSLNAEALKLHRAKDFPGAIAKFTKALDADPGHIKARYNLACSYALAGQHDEALVLLAEFAKRPESPLCTGRLLRAKEDKDWESLWQSPAFIALTADVKALDKSLEVPATMLAQNAGSGNAKLKSFVHPRKRIKVVTTAAECDEDCESTSEITGYDAFVERFDADFSPDTEGKVSCNSTCCDYDYSEYLEECPDCVLGTVFLTHVCFSVDSGGAITVSEMHLRN